MHFNYFFYLFYYFISFSFLLFSINHLYRDCQARDEVADDVIRNAKHYGSPWPALASNSAPPDMQQSKERKKEPYRFKLNPTAKTRYEEKIKTINGLDPYEQKE